MDWTNLLQRHEELVIRPSPVGIAGVILRLSDRERDLHVERAVTALELNTLKIGLPGIVDFMRRDMNAFAERNPRAVEPR